MLTEEQKAADKAARRRAATDMVLADKTQEKEAKRKAELRREAAKKAAQEKKASDAAAAKLAAEQRALAEAAARAKAEAEGIEASRLEAERLEAEAAPQAAAEAAAAAAAIAAAEEEARLAEAAQKALEAREPAWVRRLSRLTSMVPGALAATEANDDGSTAIHSGQGRAWGWHLLGGRRMHPTSAILFAREGDAETPPDSNDITAKRTEPTPDSPPRSPCSRYSHAGGSAASATSSRSSAVRVRLSEWPTEELPQAVAQTVLVLRGGSSLDSPVVGKLPKWSRAFVLEMEETTPGTHRALVTATASTAAPLGWVTSSRDGDELLRIHPHGGLDKSGLDPHDSTGRSVSGEQTPPRGFYTSSWGAAWGVSSARPVLHATLARVSKRMRSNLPKRRTPRRQLFFGSPRDAATGLARRPESQLWEAALDLGC